MAIAIIGPHAGRRSVVAKAVSSAEGRTVREFAVYPEEMNELPRLLEQRFDVMMIDLDSDQNYALHLVQTIAALGSVNVIVYSSRNDPTLGMIASHAGASDFLPIPDVADAAPAPRPVPERTAPVPARPVQTGVPETNGYAQNGNGHARPRPEAPAFNGQQGAPYQQNSAPVRVAQPAGRPVEPTPRPLVPQNVVSRPAPEPRAIPTQAATPVQRPVQNAAPRAVQVPVPSAPRPAPPAPAQNSIERQIQNAVGVPLEPPAHAAASVTHVEAKDASGGIETDADVLALFNYGKGKTESQRDPEEQPPSSMKKWVFVSAGILIIAGLIVAVVLRQLNQKPTPQVQSAPVEAAVVSQPTPPPADVAVPAPSATTSATTAQPLQQTLTKPSPGVPAGTTAVEQVQAPVRQVSSDMMDAQLSAQSRISKDIGKAAPSEENPPAGLVPVSMDSGSGMQGAALGGFAKVNVVPALSMISAGVAEGMATHKTPPIYPKIAKDSHVSGTVVLAATINRSGLIEGIKVVSGPQMLRGSAVEAVKTWRYRPYLLNNQPVAVQTTINVVFTLGRD
jgi:periplasmic protein TonB